MFVCCHYDSWGNVVFIVAGRFDGRKRHEKEVQENGGKDSTLEQAKKHYEEHMLNAHNLQAKLDKAHHRKKRARASIMEMKGDMHASFGEIASKEEEKKEN